MRNLRKIHAVIVGLVPLLMVGQLQAAAAFDPSYQPFGSLAPLELSNTDLSAGAKAYRAWFENGAWQGDVIEYTVSTSGVISTSVSLAATSPSQGTPATNWSAHVTFANAEIADSDYWTNSRKIVTYNGTTQKAFRWGNLSVAQKAALDLSAYDASAASSDILDYVRGDRSGETPTGRRNRYGVMGDIIHSNPTYVGPPDQSYTENAYATFAATHSPRDARVYVGANDGMLHAFEAEDDDDGDEAWAYIPSMVIGELDRLSVRPYNHWYYVDGHITVADAYFAKPSQAAAWHTVLVGGLGAGGRGLYGLDITTATMSSETSTDEADVKVMWELDATSDTDLGYTYSRPVIAKLGDGNWYAVMGNGYNSADGTAVLYIVALGTGVVKKIDTLSGSVGSPNGLSAPSLVDVDGDGDADVVYAGDIDGDLWKFDVSGDDPDSDWVVAFGGDPLHDGLATQAIIEAPEVTLHPTQGHLVFFGTGRLYTEDDQDDVSTQALYGIWDYGTLPDTPVLLAQTLSGDLEYTATDISETVQTVNPDAAISWGTHHGWKVELPAGFRVLSPPQLRGGRFKATIHEPIDDANYIIEVAYTDGGAPDAAVFDLNRSSTLNSADNVDINNDGPTDSIDRVVMWKQPAGIMSQTTIARVSNGIDAQLLNYVVPPIPEPCSGDCVDGFQGGHIDVDSDMEGLFVDAKGKSSDQYVGAATSAHSHQYDKTVERVYVDYFDHGADTKQIHLNDADLIPQSTEFVMVVANADLSPGSVLSLNDVEYNVVEYQALIHDKLRFWNGTGALTDNADTPNSLIFTAGGLNDALEAGDITKAARHDFDDMSLLLGGVHPSNTKCVKEDDAVTNGRYRNGALVTQAINIDVFVSCDPAIGEDGPGCSMANLIVQNPTDLAESVVLGDGTQVELNVDYDDSDSIEFANYEVIGGLRADISGLNDDDALWESTVFWHYGGDSCYGDTDWEADVEEVRDELIFTQEEWDEMLEDLGYTSIAEGLAATADCKDIKTGKTEGGIDGCKDQYEDVIDLAELEETIFVEDVTPEDYDLDSDGETPVIIGGAAADTGMSAGPNFDVGRRTWTDVTDD